MVRYEWMLSRIFTVICCDGSLHGTRYSFEWSWTSWHHSLAFELVLMHAWALNCCNIISNYFMTAVAWYTSLFCTGEYRLLRMICILIQDKWRAFEALVDLCSKHVSQIERPSQWKCWAAFSFGIPANREPSLSSLTLFVLQQSALLYPHHSNQTCSLHNYSKTIDRLTSMLFYDRLYLSDYGQLCQLTLMSAFCSICAIARPCVMYIR